VIENRGMTGARRRAATILALGVAIAIVAAGCSSSSSHSASLPATTTPKTTPKTTPTAQAAECEHPHAAGQFAQSFTFDGVARTYQLYVPKGYTGNRKVPLVLNFHGFGSNAVQQMIYGDFRPEADLADFLIVAPNGQVPAARHFNLRGEAGLQNDVDMVGSLISHLEATLCVNPRRVYSAGLSDGGAMTSVLACRMSNRIAAFATVALVLACPATRPVPIVAFNGTADPVVPFNGGTVNCCGGPTIGSAPAAMASWAKVDHCSLEYRDELISSEVTRRRWTGCAMGNAPVFYIVNGGGHTWPGSIPIPRLGKTTKQIDASETIWKFFQLHALATA